MGERGPSWAPANTSSRKRKREGHCYYENNLNRTIVSKESIKMVRGRIETKVDLTHAL